MCVGVDARRVDAQQMCVRAKQRVKTELSTCSPSFKLFYHQSFTVEDHEVQIIALEKS